MIKTNFIMKNNRKLRIRVRFNLFYYELASTDPRCNMLQTLPGRKKYEEKMSNEQPLCELSAMKNILIIFFRCT